MRRISGEILAEPACVAGCDPCFRRCALARIHLSWWEREEERLLRGRVVEGDPRRGAWLAELAEAEEQLQRLRQGMTPYAPSCRGAAWLAGLPAAPARARLH
jgi:hypothetical protein